MQRLLMAEQWNSFATTVIPMNISATQRREMRRAFYAGGQAILFGLIAALAPGSEPTAEDLTVMSDLQQELSDFATSVKEGRA